MSNAVQGTVQESEADVVVIGAGISGLSAALRFHDRAPDARVIVLESGPRAGGVLQTTERQGFLIESSADSFITNVPWAIDLCRRVGLSDELIPTDPNHRRAFVVSRGRLQPIPEGLHIMAPSSMWSVIRSPILSPLGKLRLGLERFVPPGPGTDESLAGFARRRLGREAYERLIQPLVGGMYTGDPEKLSVQATLPRFLEMEQQHGSLIRATQQSARSARSRPAGGSGARYSLFTGLRKGVSQLVEAVLETLPAGTVETDSPVDRLERDSAGFWRIDVAGIRPRSITARAIVLATPARAAAHLLERVEPVASRLLAEIESTSCAIVSLAYRREQVAHRLDGFGFVVPFIENLDILSGSFSSVKFEGRAPEGHVLLRTFLGGSRRPELVEADDASLLDTSTRALGKLLGIVGEPLFGEACRWRNVMPQYDLDHPGRIAGLRRAVGGFEGTLALAGNYLTGVGVPQCVHQGQTAADQVLESLEPAASERG